MVKATQSRSDSNSDRKGRTMDATTEMERALGAEAVRSLAAAAAAVGRRRVPTATAPVTTPMPAGPDAGRRARPGRRQRRRQRARSASRRRRSCWRRRRGSTTRWRAPEALAEQLSRERHTLRTRGQAIDAAVDGHRAGVAVAPRRVDVVRQRRARPVPSPSAPLRRTSRQRPAWRRRSTPPSPTPSVARRRPRRRWRRSSPG